MISSRHHARRPAVPTIESEKQSLLPALSHGVHVDQKNMSRATASTALSSTLRHHDYQLGHGSTPTGACAAAVACCPLRGSYFCAPRAPGFALVSSLTSDLCCCCCELFAASHHYQKARCTRGHGAGRSTSSASQSRARHRLVLRARGSRRARHEPAIGRVAGNIP